MEARLAALLVRRRYIFALLSLALVALIASGASKLWFESSYKIFFSDDDPRLVAYEAMEDAYTRGDNVAFVLAPDNGKVFTTANLEAVIWLTEQAWQLQRSVRVDSITNFQYSRAEQDDLIVRDLVEDPAVLDQTALDRLEAIALSEPVLVHALISEQAHVTSVNVRVELPDDSREQSAVVPELMADVYELRDAFIERYPQFDVYLMGQVVVNESFNEAAAQDTSTLVPLMFLAVIVLLTLFMRSLSTTLATIVIILVSIAATMGVSGWLGFQINQVNVSAPIIILTLAVSDCVHVLVSYLKDLRRGLDKPAAMEHALAINIKPVFLTSITTAIGFFSLNFSDSPPFRELGTSVGFGVLGAMLWSLVLLPGVMLLLPIRVRAAGDDPDRSGAMLKLANVIITRHRIIFWGVLAVAAVLISFVPRNEFNDDTVEYFDESLSIRQAFDFVQDNLTGVDSIAYSLPAGEENGIVDPQYLRDVEAFANWYRQQPEVTHVSTFTDVVKRLNRNMHGDDPAYYRLPDDRELIAQYILLYELSLPMGLDLNNQLTFNKSATKFQVNISNLNSKEIIAVEARAQAWLAANAPAIQTPGSSVSLMFAHIGQNNIEAMMRGSALALALIALTLIIALRSIKFGLLSLLPNAFPATISFGLWGIFVGQVNLAVAAVFSITLGIVVDNTVHFFSKYLRARQQLGHSTEDAIRYAFTTVGAALAVTTVALAAGFLILAQSSFDVNASMGMMTAMTIGIALVFDLLFLPGLLLRFDRSPRD